MGIHSVMNMKDESIKKAWLTAYKKELKTLITIKQPWPKEKKIPTMETHRVKPWSDGTLGKLKCRIVVQGDL